MDQADALLKLEPALYLVATPIGTADDITLHALNILRCADIIAAEDTRRTRNLLDIHGITLKGRPITPYHDHNGAAQRPRLLAALAEGKSVALVSDAGTPLIADPGFALVRDAVAQNLHIRAAPGASALLVALSLAGLPTDRFFFAGFLPPKSAARKRLLLEYAGFPSTLVFYESPRRMAASLSDMAEILGAERPAATCRELTKRFEEVQRGTLQDLASQYAKDGAPKGEIVLVVGPPLASEIDEAMIESALIPLLKEMSVKDAAKQVALKTGRSRKTIYDIALSLRTTLNDTNP